MLAETQAPKIRVLVVDDSRLVRIAAAKMFGGEFDVVMAEDGKKAWKILQQDPDIEVVFTDLVMPEMDGFELLKQIRTSNDDNISNLPVIVATGADNPEVARQKAISMGATDFITKPFDASALRTRGVSYAKYHQTNKALQQQTTIDVLTGLVNARGLYRQLEKELAFVERHQANMAVMSVEVDFFKDLFIKIGRAGTEVLIKRLAKALLATVRKEDTVARTGVGSFAITLPLVSDQNSLELADRICSTVEKFRAKLDGNHLEITVSVGVSIVDEHIVDAETALEISNMALSRATERGRSQLHKLTVESYFEIMEKRERANLSIDNVLEQLNSGHQDDVIGRLDDVLLRLSPLLALVSQEQKQQIFRYH